MFVHLPTAAAISDIRLTENLGQLSVSAQNTSSSSITYLNKDKVFKFAGKTPYPPTTAIAVFLNSRNVHFGEHRIRFVEVLA